MPTPDFVFDLGALPATKSDKTGIPGAEDPNKWWAAADVNYQTSIFASLRSAVRSARWLGISDSPAVPTAPAAGLTQLRSQGGKLQVSENGNPFKRVCPELRPEDFGAKGDNIADDTAALQATFDAAASAKMGGIFIQPGKYRITKTVFYRGAPSAQSTVTIRGQDGGGQGVQTTAIVWDGPDPIAAVAGAVVRTGGGTVTVTAAGHPFQVGDTVALVNDDPTGDLARGLKTITAKTSSTFTYTEAGNNNSNSATAVFTYPMMVCTGLNYSQIRDFELNGNGRNMIGLWIQDNSQSVVLDRVGIMQCYTKAAGVPNTGSCCLALGDEDEIQCSEIIVSSCQFGGFDAVSVRTDMAVRAMGLGNAKNFRFVGCQVENAETAMEFGGARYTPGGGQIAQQGGPILMLGCTFINVNRTCVNLGTSQLNFDTCEIETNTPASMLISQAYLGSNYGSLRVANTAWYGSAPHVGGNPAIDDVVIRYSGQVTLENNQFWNIRTGTGFGQGLTGTALPVVCVDDLDQATPTTVSGSGRAQGSVVSRNNVYINAAADGYAPIITPDGTNRANPANGPAGVVSECDQGGSPGAMVWLRNARAGIQHTQAQDVTGSVTASGAVSGASVTASGAVSGASVTASGAVSGASVTATGSIQGAKVASTGALEVGVKIITVADSPFTMDASQTYLRVDASGGNVTVNLPDVDAIPAGRIYVIKKREGSTNTVTIVAPTGGIDFAGSIVLAHAMDYVTLITAGPGWDILGIGSDNGKNGNTSGTVTISDAATSAAVVFPVAEPDAVYRILLGSGVAAGIPAAGSLSAYQSIKGVAGFTVFLQAAPGAGNAVVVDWKIVRD